MTSCDGRMTPGCFNAVPEEDTPDGKLVQKDPHEEEESARSHGVRGIGGVCDMCAISLRIGTKDSCTLAPHGVGI